MFVELHILQNFVPSNLNRDDTNAPKDCIFGGYRRARISSQAIKRATRTHPHFKAVLDTVGGVRTRKLILEVADAIAAGGVDRNAAIDTIAKVFDEGGIKRVEQGSAQGDAKHYTNIILFLDRPAIARMADLFRERWDDLTRGDTVVRNATRSELADILAAAVQAPDIGMFGRMIEVKGTTEFGKRQLRVDAAAQVAHAFSTNETRMEFDFFTAVEELARLDETGAAMMDAAQFNSACYYRYANVDLDQLHANVKSELLARKTLEAFVRAAVAAIPTGKQTSTAAHNLPMFILAVVQRSDLRSLANAFVDPVRLADQAAQQNSHADLVVLSERKLDHHWGQLARVYGTDGIEGKWFVSLNEVPLHHLESFRVQTLDELVANVMNTVSFSSSDVG